MSEDKVKMRPLPHSSCIEIKGEFKVEAIVDLINEHIHKYIHSFLLCNNCHAIHDTTLYVQDRIAYKRCGICLHSDPIDLPIMIETECEPLDNRIELLMKSYPPIITHIRNRTFIAGLEKLTGRLHINMKHLIKYLGKIFNQSINPKQLSFIGKIESDEINRVLSLYIKKYHICDKCNKWNAIQLISKEGQFIKKCTRSRCKHFSILDQ